MDLCVMQDRVDVMIIRWALCICLFSALCLHHYSLKCKGKIKMKRNLRKKIQKT